MSADSCGSFQVPTSVTLGVSLGGGSGFCGMDAADVAALNILLWMGFGSRPSSAAHWIPF